MHDLGARSVDLRRRVIAAIENGSLCRQAAARCRGKHRHAVALLQPSADHAQEKTGRAAGQDRPDVLSRREAWLEGQLDPDPPTLVFIDGRAPTVMDGAGTKVARLRGPAPRGERLRAAIPHGRWKATTFEGALRRTGMTAPMVLDGPMTGERFLAYTEQMLVPTPHPGEVVILDNLPAPKGTAAREAVEAAGAMLLFLLPYAPDFHPIENAFAKLRTLLRQAAARTVDHLGRAIGESLDAFTPAECAHHFTAAGHDAC
jgi:transposase